MAVLISHFMLLPFIHHMNIIVASLTLRSLLTLQTGNARLAMAFLVRSLMHIYFGTSGLPRVQLKPRPQQRRCPPPNLVRLALHYVLGTCFWLWESCHACFLQKGGMHNQETEKQAQGNCSEFGISVGGRISVYCIDSSQNWPLVVQNFWRQQCQSSCHYSIWMTV